MLKMVDLAGLEGVVSEFSPGVFLQVYLFPCGLPSWGMWLVFSKVTPYLGLNVFSHKLYLWAETHSLAQRLLCSCFIQLDIFMPKVRFLNVYLF